MKNYLDLVPALARVHKRQNRMSVFCIALSVFLVTVIFGMADMFIRSQILQALREGGNWHIAVREISDREAALLSVRPEVKAAARYGVLNFRGDEGYTFSGKKMILVGCDEDWVTQMQVDFLKEGRFPETDREAVITQNARDFLNVQIGGSVIIDGPGGVRLPYTVCGIVGDVPKTLSEDSLAVILTTDAYRALRSPGITSGQLEDYDSLLYIRFADHVNVKAAIQDIKNRFGLSEKQVAENVKLLGLTGQSGNDFMLRIYGAAGVLFLLVLLSGILMITGSLNSSIARRTEFFGMLRCIGATPGQIMRLVRREALGWCRSAVLFGVLAGLVLIWLLCAALRFLSPEYFEDMPVFGVSLPSILTGVLAGLLTVLLAARAPGKRASRVSPLAAVSGNAGGAQPVRKAANTAFFKVDTALGIHHAKANRKNFLLMTGSFALSIVLFLSFSVTLDFMKHSLTPLHPWTPDLSVISPDSTCSVEASLLEKLKQLPTVRRAYGRMFAYGVPVLTAKTEGGAGIKTVDLISYEKNQFAWARDYLIDGSLKEAQDETLTGLSVYEPENTLQTGDLVTLKLQGRPVEIRIAGVLSEAPFYNKPGVGTVICSEASFRQLTGEKNYTILDMQLTGKATDADVDHIRRLSGNGAVFSDKRAGNSSVRGTWYSFGIFIYGFLILIAMIAMFNIVNSIAMSVAARTGQYGVFRAIGLSDRQLAKMIAAEACSYAVMGCICGCLAGIPLNRLLYASMITFRWGSPWSVPLPQMGVILVVMILSVIWAIREPVRRIRRLSIVDTISAE